MSTNGWARPGGLAFVFLMTALIVTGCGDLFDGLGTDSVKTFTAVFTIKNDCLRTGLDPFTQGAHVQVTAEPDPISENLEEFTLPFSEEQTFSMRFELLSRGTIVTVTIVANMLCSESHVNDIRCEEGWLGGLDHSFPPASDIEDGAIIHNTFTVTEADRRLRCHPL